jgi:hypothetical protein
VMVAITMRNTSGAGHLAVAPDGSPTPAVGVLAADAAGQTRATYAVVALRGGRFSLTATLSAEVTIDVVGWYTGPSSPVGQTGLFRAARNAYA